MVSRSVEEEGFCELTFYLQWRNVTGIICKSNGDWLVDKWAWQEVSSSRVHHKGKAIHKNVTELLQSKIFLLVLTFKAKTRISHRHVSLYIFDTAPWWYYTAVHKNSAHPWCCLEGAGLPKTILFPVLEKISVLWKSCPLSVDVFSSFYSEIAAL